MQEPITDLNRHRAPQVLLVYRAQLQRSHMTSHRAAGLRGEEEEGEVGKDDEEKERKEGQEVDNAVRVLASFPRRKPLVAQYAALGHPKRNYYNAEKPGCPGPGEAAHVRVVDLRSDTVTKPGPVMRQAMAQAEVGDDVMGEDPTVNGQGVEEAKDGLNGEESLGSPVGTVLAGPRDFISKAVRCRKALGGGMRQAGVLAAAGKLSLLEMVGRLEEDHHNAKTFALALLDCAPSLFDVDMSAVETNILRFRIKDCGLSPQEVCARMGQVGEGEEASLGQGVRVLMHPHYGNSIRAVWHLGISPEDTQLAIKKMQFVA
ncbi:hypothetical protein CCH79_00003147, partial [Gambusia affinis]